MIDFQYLNQSIDAAIQFASSRLKKAQDGKARWEKQRLEQKIGQTLPRKPCERLALEIKGFEKIEAILQVLKRDLALQGASSPFSNGDDEMNIQKQTANEFLADFDAEMFKAGFDPNMQVIADYFRNGFSGEHAAREIIARLNKSRPQDLKVAA